MFATTPTVRWEDGNAREAQDEVVVEEPLEIRVRGRAVSVSMRTPGNDAELAAGFLMSEGLIRERRDVLRIEHCGQNDFENVINAVLAPLVPIDLEKLTRHVFAASSCGLCGKATIESIHAQFPAIEIDSGFSIPAATIASMSAAMRQAQTTFDRTGGVHAAALFDENGKLIIVREDVGRHNAVDKVLGYAFLHELMPLSRHVLFVSGRSSFEIMQKALAARIPVVAAVSAPSSLAAEFAQTSGQTLIGFVREARMNVYSHPKRVSFGRSISTSSSD